MLSFSDLKRPLGITTRLPETTAPEVRYRFSDLKRPLGITTQLDC